MTLSLRFTRISPTRHTFEYKTDTGVWNSVENETKSTLEHDLIHFALETEVGLKKSFYGLLASGKSYAELSDGTDMQTDTVMDTEVAHTERIVGALSGVMKGKVTPSEVIQGLSNLYEAYNQPLPIWLNEQTIIRTQESFRRLYGQWNATEFHSPMELTFKI